MKNLSTFQIGVLSAFAALAVAAVVIFSFFVSQGSSSAVGPVSIWGTFDQTTVQQVIDTLSTVHPDLQNARYTQKNPETYLNDLTNAFASGQGPDLFFLTQDQAYMQTDRINIISLDSLSHSQFENSFIDAALPFESPNGTRALPLLADPIVMYWNKDLLAASGLSQPPQYWDQFFDFARTLSVRKDDGTISRSAVSFGTFGNVAHAKEILSLLIFQAGGSITALDDNGRLTASLLADNPGAGGLTAVPAALRFYTGFADSAQPSYSWNRSLPSSDRAFAGGTLAVYFGLASEKAAIRAANPNLNFAMAPVPQIRDGKLVADSGRVYGIAVAKNAANPLGGYTVAALMAAADFSQALSSALGIPSARRDLLEQARQQANPGLAASENSIIAASAIMMRTWTDPDPERTSEIFRAMIEDTTSGALLLNEAISRAGQQINSLIGI